MSEIDPVHSLDPNAPFRYGTSWSWREPDYGEHFRRCSYCGSIHPDDLAVESTWRAEWADQKYGWPHKFYVDIPNHDPDAPFIVSIQSRRDLTKPGWEGSNSQWVAWEDLTEEQHIIVRRDGFRDAEDDQSSLYMFGTRPNHYGKFCTDHLADPTIDPKSKETIERISGISFTFENGRVRWRPYQSGDDDE